MIGHLGVSTPGPFLCTTTPQPQCIDINISSSVYTGIAGDRTQVANHCALTYALTLSATGSLTKIWVSQRTHIIVKCDPVKCWHISQFSWLSPYPSKYCWIYLILLVRQDDGVMITNQARNDTLIHRDWTPGGLNTRAIPMHNNTSTTMCRYQHFVLHLHRHCRG